MKGQTNWKALREMSEEEIEKRAREDEDSYCPSSKELNQFKVVQPVGKMDVKQIRQRLGLSQQRFSMYFGFSLRTIQEWEQGRREPSGAIRNFLKVISKNPTAVQNALVEDDQ